MKTKSAAAEVDGDAREAGNGEARKSGAGRKRGKNAFEMAYTVNPTVVDLEGEERAAGAKHAEDFGEGEVLHFTGLEMVKDENGNGGREGLTSERQMRGVAAQDSPGMCVVIGFQFARGIVVILERRNTRDAFA